MSVHRLPVHTPPSHLVLVDASLPDLDRLLAALPASARVSLVHENGDALAQMAILIPWLAPVRHAHPAGLLATRRFIELKSRLP